MTGRPTGDRPDRDPAPVRFAQSVRLSKAEAFSACQVLADADRRLVRARCFAESDGLAALFDLLEDRLARAPTRASRSGARPGAQDRSGS
jgi:hypothetical protein